MTVSQPKPKLEKDKFSVLKEHLRAMEQNSLYDSNRMTNLYLIQDIMVSKKFEIPEFEIIQ